MIWSVTAIRENLSERVMNRIQKERTCRLCQYNEHLKSRMRGMVIGLCPYRYWTMKRDDKQEFSHSFKWFGAYNAFRNLLLLQSDFIENEVYMVLLGVVNTSEESFLQSWLNFSLYIIFRCIEVRLPFSLCRHQCDPNTEYNYNTNAGEYPSMQILDSLTNRFSKLNACFGLREKNRAHFPLHIPAASYKSTTGSTHYMGVVPNLNLIHDSDWSTCSAKKINYTLFRSLSLKFETTCINLSIATSGMCRVIEF